MAARGMGAVSGCYRDGTTTRANERAETAPRFRRVIGLPGSWQELWRCLVQQRWTNSLDRPAE